MGSQIDGESGTVKYGGRAKSMPKNIKTSGEPRMLDDNLYSNPGYTSTFSPKDLPTARLPHAVAPRDFQSSDLRLQTADRPAHLS